MEFVPTGPTWILNRSFPFFRRGVPGNGFQLQETVVGIITFFPLKMSTALVVPFCILKQVALPTHLYMLLPQTLATSLFSYWKRSSERNVGHSMNLSLHKQTPISRTSKTSICPGRYDKRRKGEKKICTDGCQGFFRRR